MAETDFHRRQMNSLIEALDEHFKNDRRVYVSGNLLMFYVPGNKRKHVSPDVFVVKDVDKHDRLNYLIWEEGKEPDFIIEVTSSSTKSVDLKKKFALYRDVLHVKEYFLFDPLGDYLDPRLRGFRLRGGEYIPIAFVNGRLPSQVLKLHLERDDGDLRLYDPKTGQWLRTREEINRSEDTAQSARVKAEHERQQESEARQQAEIGRQQAELTCQQEVEARRQAELTCQQAELARRQAELTCQQAELARQQEAEARRQEAEARRQAEEEVFKLRQELEEVRLKQTTESNESR